jgi:outer membrane murein-binding lipoprotein Lpp
MELIADALLIAGAVGAAVYCRALARRLGALRDMDSGLGAAIAALSRQVDEMRSSLEAAKSISGDQTREVAQLTARAEMAAGRLELLLASLHEGGERRSVGRQSNARRAAREDTSPRHRPGWHDETADDDPDAPTTPEEIEERAAVEAVLRSLSRNRTERDDAAPPHPRPAVAARRPSIFDEHFDESDDSDGDDPARDALAAGAHAREQR